MQKKARVIRKKYPHHSLPLWVHFIRLDLCWADVKYGIDRSIPSDLTQPNDHEDHDLDFLLA